MEHFLILVSTITGCVSIFAFSSLQSSSIGLKVCAITAGIKKYKLIVKKRKRNIK